MKPVDGPLKDLDLTVAEEHGFDVASLPEGSVIDFLYDDDGKAVLAGLSVGPGPVPAGPSIPGKVERYRLVGGEWHHIARWPDRPGEPLRPEGRI